jgi:hypothetical protein
MTLTAYQSGAIDGYLMYVLVIYIFAIITFNRPIRVIVNDNISYLSMMVTLYQRNKKFKRILFHTTAILLDSFTDFIAHYNRMTFKLHQKLKIFHIQLRM